MKKYNHCKLISPEIRKIVTRKFVILNKNEKMRYDNCRVHLENKAKSVWQSTQNMNEIQCPQGCNRETI